MSSAPEVPQAAVAGDWWISALIPGQTVDLHVYGERLSGQLRSLKDRVLEVSVPLVQQRRLLSQSTAQGVAEISIDGGAALAPVACWPAGDCVRMRVVGPVELVQRRLHVRVPLDVAVVLTWPGDRPGTAERVISRTSDLSLGGLRVQPASTVWPSPGAMVSALVDLPGGAVQLHAESVGKTPDYGLRLRFTQNSTEATEAVANCVSRLRTGPDAAGLPDRT